MVEPNPRNKANREKWARERAERAERERQEAETRPIEEPQPQPHSQEQQQQQPQPEPEPQRRPSPEPQQQPESKQRQPSSEQNPKRPPWGPNQGRRISLQNQDPNKPSRNIHTTEDDKYGAFELIALAISYTICVLTFPISVFVCLIVLKEFYRVVIFRLGRVRKNARGPGLTWILPCIDSFVKVDLRTNCVLVPPQDVLTRDSVTIRVDAVLYYFIHSPMDAVIQVTNVHQSTVLIAQTTLRNIVGSKALIELLTSREHLSREIGVAVDDATEPWGVKVERVELMDISLPESLQRALASEAEAHREARAKKISAEGELNASRALKEASDVMATNKITLQLRHLQILTAIAAERNCRIIFPFPMEIMTPFLDGGSKGGGAKGGGGGGENKPQSDRQSGLFGSLFAKKPEPEPKLDLIDERPLKKALEEEKKPEAEQKTALLDQRSLEKVLEEVKAKPKDQPPMQSRNEPTNSPDESSAEEHRSSGTQTKKSALR